jgi:hypothetical protein
MLLALNVDESQLAEADPQNLGLGEGVGAMVVSAPIEAEVAHLDPENQILGYPHKLTVKS